MRPYLKKKYKEILILVACGYTNAEIAARFNTTLCAIKRINGRICERLSLKNRVQMTHYVLFNINFFRATSAKACEELDYLESFWKQQNENREYRSTYGMRKKIFSEPLDKDL